MTSKRKHSESDEGCVQTTSDKKGYLCDTMEFTEQLVLKTAICTGLLSDVNSIHPYTITPLRVLNSNAADTQQGYEFSKAYCSVFNDKPSHIFGSVFEKGVYILLRYLDEKHLPQNKQEKHVLNKLIDYLMDRDTHSLLEKSEMRTDEEMTILLANHLFAKLSASPPYILNRHSEGRLGTECPCSSPGCKLSGCYGDTSIGNEEVWHGSLDAIVNNALVLTPFELDPVEGEQQSNKLRKQHNSRIIAETIVFSFVQKFRHSERDNFLCPCVGVSGKDLVCYFYDSEHDVLLESSPISLFYKSPNGECKIDFVGIIASWLIVNYKYLCSGLTESMLLPEKKAGFFTHVGSKLTMYESALKLGNVGKSWKKRRDCHIVDTSDPVVLGSREIIDRVKMKQIGHAFM